MLNRPSRFRGGALRSLYPYAADNLIEACATSPQAVIDFLEDDLDHVQDPERERLVRTLLNQIKQKN